MNNIEGRSYSCHGSVHFDTSIIAHWILDKKTILHSNSTITKYVHLYAFMLIRSKTRERYIFIKTNKEKIQIHISFEVFVAYSCKPTRSPYGFPGFVSQSKHKTIKSRKCCRNILSIYRLLQWTIRGFG